MEQLVARRAHNPKVAGSSPVPATTSPVHPVHRAFHLRLVGLFKRGHPWFVDCNEWLVEWLNKRETRYT